MTFGLLQRKGKLEMKCTSALCVCILYSGGTWGQLEARLEHELWGLWGAALRDLPSAGAAPCPSPPCGPAGCPLADHKPFWGLALLLQTLTVSQVIQIMIWI